MSTRVQVPSERRTRRAIAKLLKTDGPIDSAQLAERLGLTAMAIRQHLYALQREGLVTHEERRVPIGRPAKFWRLTRDADHLFPEAYAELSVALIDSVKDAFGDEGLERVLTSRCARQRVDYGKRIKPGDSLEKKLKELAKVRTEEGYMAEIRKEGKESFLLVENHCPICAAANACQGFCSTELDLFRSVLGAGVSVERAEHIIKGDQRCVYRIKQGRG
ncbi:MAG TPA: metalloregulator ArsR/SmtB family transcription factor [Pyrinomonadaceae bacterium]|jgi:predicted ArsR family transcriptional regulator|nr:metalloregulator ArsR/SmtB family transcription factor [Pyrinomonadaceae bacterium]